jgi:glycosyltransferase involved in cell wall biosynthesis
VGNNAGIQIDPYDIPGIVNAVLTLLDNSEQRSKMKLAGRAQAAKFALKNKACAIKEIYEQTIRDF